MNQSYADAITEYNDILCGIKKRFSKDVVIDEKAARAIGQFAFEYYLQWTPEDIRGRLNKEILQQLRLDKLFEKHANFPHELNSKKDFFYYAHWLYPNQIPYDIRHSVLNVYRSVLSGRRNLYSTNFFNDDYALERAEICLQEALRKKEFKNEYEMYAFFASDEVIDFINEYKLSKPLQMYYNTPLQFLHFALPNEYKNEFWFNYFIFKMQYEKRLFQS